MLMRNESFKEDEHPRDEDGKFADSGKNTVKAIRDVSYDIQVSEIQDKIDEDIKRMEENPKADYYKLIDIYKKDIEDIKERKEGNKYRYGDMPQIFIQKKQNTHTNMTKGFKHDKTKITIGGTFFKKGEHPMRQARLDRILNAIQSVWNELPNEYRDNVDNLKIYNNRGHGGRRSGTFTTSHKKQEGTNHLTVRIHSSDKASDVIKTFIHEIGHGIWHNKFEKTPEKIQKFKQGIDKLIATNGGITEYVQDDHIAMQSIKEIFLKSKHIRNWRKLRVDSWDMSGEDIEQSINYQRNQLNTIVANETHSEALAFILGGFDKWSLGKGVDKETMKRYFKLVEELHK